MGQRAARDYTCSTYLSYIPRPEGLRARMAGAMVLTTTRSVAPEFSHAVARQAVRLELHLHAVVTRFAAEGSR